MKNHVLKCWPKYFADVVALRKKFEARKNDRDFKEGDTLELREYDPDSKAYTGRRWFGVIGYVLDKFPCGLPQYEGFCVFGILPRGVGSLYFEAHVTIEPVFGYRLELAKSVSQTFGFRVAELLMQKRSEDTPEQSKYDTFTTGRDNNFASMNERTVSLVVALKEYGFKVLRYKIEDTLIDSKIKDVDGIL